MIAVEVSAHVNPTEDRDRVQSAIEGIFPALEYELQEREGFTSRLVGSGGYMSGTATVLLNPMTR